MKKSTFLCLMALLTIGATFPAHTMTDNQKALAKIVLGGTIMLLLPSSSSSFTHEQNIMNGVETNSYRICIGSDIPRLAGFIMALIGIKDLFLSNRP